MKTLIHLVSDQTMQNLLPMLALRPERVIQVRSRPEKFRKAAENLRIAVLEAGRIPWYSGFRPEFVEEVIDEDSPSLESTRHVVARHLDAHPAAFINVTGGTKLMSLGAYLAAERRERCGRLYCDTGQRKFISLGPAQLPDLPAFEDLAATLTLSVVMAAHGLGPEAWTFEEATPALQQVGCAGIQVYKKAPETFRAFADGIRRHFREDRGRVPESHRLLEELCRQPIPLPRGSDAIREFLEAGVAAGLLIRDEAGNYRPAVKPVRKAVERLANMLDGSWLELYVMNLLSHNPRKWADPHWSVQLRRIEDIPIGETDVVVFDISQCALHIISCKTRVHQPLETLEALTQRRRDMGGLFAKATLAVLDLPENERAKLRNWSRYLQIQLLIGDAISATLGHDQD